MSSVYSGFTFTIVAMPVFFMSSSCPGPTVVSAADYGAIALTNASQYTNNMNCSIILFSGSNSFAVLFSVYSMHTELDHDVLSMFDGNSSHAPPFSGISGAPEPW